MPSTLIFSDDFESYTPNVPITSPWTGGLGNTVISTTAPHTGSQCLGTGAGGNGASPTRTFSSVGTWAIDVWAWITASYGGSDPPASNAPGMIMTDSGGGVTNLLFGTAGSTVWSIPFGATLASFSLSTGAWHHLQMTCTMSASGSSSMVVDGGAPINFSGDTRGSGNNTTVNELIVPGQVVGASPAFELAIDDLFVYSGGLPVKAGGTFFSSPFGLVAPIPAAEAAAIGVSARALRMMHDNPTLHRRDIARRLFTP